MKQIIHIFRKDTRHHWLEIVLCLAALLAYTWHEVHSWGQGFNPMHSSSTRFWLVTITVLLPLSWWFLVLRVVQSEPLVGDRQFWTTRPYEWKKLLAAKALFVLVYINVPLLLAGVFLLIKAGFSPAPHWLGLLWMQLLLIQIPLLPMVALASVTRNIAQGLLALLGVVLYVAGTAALSSVVESISTDASDWLQGAVLVIVSVLAIWLQYARRRTALARVLLAAGAVVIFIIVAVEPYFFVHTDRDYPLPPAGQQPFRAALVPGNRSSSKDAPDTDEPVNIVIPIQTSGPPDGSVAQARAVMLTIEAPDGFRWNSGWQTAYRLLLPGQNSWRQDFEIKNKIFERLKSVAVKARVSVGISVLRDQDARQIAAGSGEFVVPDVGRCRIDPKDLGLIQCHSPLVKPSTLLVRTDSSASTCPVPGALEDKESPGSAYDWEWNGDSRPAEYGIDPVESFELYFLEGGGPGARLCPGTPLIVSFPKPVENTRAEFEVNGFKLDDYLQEKFSGDVVFGVRKHSSHD